MAKTVPTWGYNAEGGRLFELAPGEALPPGFVDSPAKVVATPVEAVPPAEPEIGDELGTLKVKAAELGVVLRGRPTVERLKAAIAIAEDDGE